MFEVLREMFSYNFLIRAVVVGALVSVCAALLGVSLVLKRYSMIGDGLSHVGFGALALATAMNAAPLVVSVPVVVTAAFLLLRLSENSKIKGDAAIALISTGALAVGVVIIARTTGMNTDVCNYLFGSILAMSKSDVYLSVVLSAAVLVLFALFYHKLFAITFDDSFARAGGVNTRLYNMLIALLTALTIVLGMRMMGAMLISSLIVFPALTSMRVFKTWRGVTVSSALISIVCFFIGVVLSYLYALPTGASVVIVNIAAFLIFWAVNGLRPAVRRAAAISLVCLIASSCAEEGRNLSFGGQTNNAGTVAVDISETALQGASSSNDAPKAAAVPKDIEIKEKMFIAQTNEIYLNAEDYIGSNITLEGLFKTQESWVEGGDPYCFVLRYGPGCCGADGNAGFEVAWNKDNPAAQEAPYPAVDEWVRAEGTLSFYEEDDYPYLYIRLDSLETLEERGAEFVMQ